jgi:hypothetical protein
MTTPRLRWPLLVPFLTFALAFTLVMRAVLPAAAQEATAEAIPDLPALDGQTETGPWTFAHPEAWLVEVEAFDGGAGAALLLPFAGAADLLGTGDTSGAEGPVALVQFQYGPYDSVFAGASIAGGLSLATTFGPILNSFTQTVGAEAGEINTVTTPDGREARSAFFVNELVQGIVLMLEPTPETFVVAYGVVDLDSPDWAYTWALTEQMILTFAYDAEAAAAPGA